MNGCTKTDNKQIGDHLPTLPLIHLNSGTQGVWGFKFLFDLILALINVDKHFDIGLFLPCYFNWI